MKADRAKNTSKRKKQGKTTAKRAKEKTNNQDENMIPENPAKNEAKTAEGAV